MKQKKCGLEILRGPGQGSLHILNRDIVVIGRSWFCDVKLDDPSVSRQHAQLTFSDEQPTILNIKDLKSSNGVYVNKKRISFCQLKTDDEIVIGKCLLKVRYLTESECREHDMVVTHDELEFIPSKGDLIASIDVDEASHTPDYETQKPAQKRLKTIFRLSEILALQIELTQKAERIINLLFDEINAEQGVILIKKTVDDNLEPVAIQHRNHDGTGKFRVSWTIIEKCIQKRMGILANDAQIDPRFDRAESIVQGKFKSVLSIPLFAHQRLLGVIFLSSSLQSGIFQENDLEFLMSIARQIALVIEHDQLIRAHMAREKLAEVGELISGLSHYFKNVLVSVSSAREMIEEALQHNAIDAIHQQWPLVVEATDRINDLVGNMLYFATASIGNKQKTDLNELIGGILYLYNPMIDEKSIKLNLSLAPDLPNLTIDPTSVTRALRNILQNSLEAVWNIENPEVTIETKTDKKVKNIEIRILDNGQGIDPRNIDKIFHYLFSTKGYEGTGLGLFIAKQIISEHDGSISVFSPRGQATEFRINLPIH